MGTWRQTASCQRTALLPEVTPLADKALCRHDCFGSLRGPWLRRRPVRAQEPPTPALARAFPGGAVLVNAKAPGAVDTLVGELQAAAEAGQKVG